MVVIQSPDGHDGFLLEFEQLNHHVRDFITKHLSEYIIEPEEDGAAKQDFSVTQKSTFGEAEVEDAMKW